MYKVSFTSHAYAGIDSYILNYRMYFENLYQDTGIWEEDKILAHYITESEDRYFEIVNLVNKNLSQDIPSYPNNQAIIRWRTKILLVSFDQVYKTRIITHISIR